MKIDFKLDKLFGCLKTVWIVVIAIAVIFKLFGSNQFDLQINEYFENMAIFQNQIVIDIILYINFLVNSLLAFAFSLNLTFKETIKKSWIFLLMSPVMEYLPIPTEISIVIFAVIVFIYLGYKFDAIIRLAIIYAIQIGSVLFFCWLKLGGLSDVYTFYQMITLSIDTYLIMGLSYIILRRKLLCQDLGFFGQISKRGH